MTAVPAWVRTARPAVPEAFLPWLSDVGGGEERPDTDALAAAAEEALERAIRAGDARAGAFHLLAADALLTWACEAALDDPGPDGVLAGLATRVADGPGRG